MAKKKTTAKMAEAMGGRKANKAEKHREAEATGTAKADKARGKKK